ncbi:Cyclic nucleotide-binding domain-containing protein 2 [Paramecium bursaria]
MNNDQEFYAKIIRYFFEKEAYNRIMQSSKVAQYARNDNLVITSDDNNVYLVESGQLQPSQFIYKPQQNIQIIRCNSDCQLRVISGTFYHNLQKARQLYLRLTLEFIFQLQLFKSVEKQNIEFSIQHTKRGQIIQKEGEYPKYLYIILKGEFIIRKNALQEDLQVRQIDIATLTTKEFVGDYEILNDINLQETLICNSNEGELILIKQEIIKRLCDGQKVIKKFQEQKQKYRDIRINKIKSLHIRTLSSDQEPLKEINNKFFNKTKPLIKAEIPPINEDIKKKILLKLGLAPKSTTQIPNIQNHIVRMQHSVGRRRRIYSNHS